MTEQDAFDPDDFNDLVAHPSDDNSGGDASPLQTIDLDGPGPSSWGPITPDWGAVHGSDPAASRQARIIYYMAMGGDAQDLHPDDQPYARFLSATMQPRPPLGPGLLDGGLRQLSNKANPAMASNAGFMDDRPDDQDIVVGQTPATAAPADLSTSVPDLSVQPADGSLTPEGTAWLKGAEQNSLNGGPEQEPDDDASYDDAAATLRQRDIDYLDRYYDAASRYSKQYNISPAFVLGLGSESGFGTAGTYKRTGDAFGMTGGSTDHMTTASSPEENVLKFFQTYGPRLKGVGNDIDAFIDALQARTANGKPIVGLKMYNSRHQYEWEKMARAGIGQMQRDLPTYISKRPSKAKET